MNDLTGADERLCLDLAIEKVLYVYVLLVRCI